MHITIVGTGYVGLVTGTCFANTGNDVTCLDVDQRKIDLLHEGVCPIYEPGLEERIKRNVDAGRLTFTSDRESAYRGAEAIFICVGTPSDQNGHAKLDYVLGAATDIGHAIEADEANEEAPPIVVVKSTVPVGTNPKVRSAIQAVTSKPFRMASNPEFLKEGAALLDFDKPDRVVLGVDDELTGHRLSRLYEPYVRQGNPIFVMDIPSAEMVKYAANAMLATKISFINEIAGLCEAYGADINRVRTGMCSDSRIGRSFFYPGLGYGGSCFPKDVLACVSMGTESDTPVNLLSAVHQVNQSQRPTFVAKILRHFGADLTGKKFAFWGLAFKPGTDDVREAPSLTIIQSLLDAGASITAYDSVATETTQREIGDAITYVDHCYDALDGADALIVCTEWEEFRHPNFDEIKSRLNSPVIFDGRNIYGVEEMAELGVTYYSVGRTAVNA